MSKSAHLDGFIQICVLPSKYVNSPTQFPPTQINSNALHILDLLIEALKCFDQELVKLAPSRSYKSSGKVHVDGYTQVSVPWESVYDSELMRILTHWLSRFGWEVTRQWHL